MQERVLQRVVGQKTKKAVVEVGLSEDKVEFLEEEERVSNRPRDPRYLILDTQPSTKTQTHFSLV